MMKQKHAPPSYMNIMTNQVIKDGLNGSFSTRYNILTHSVMVRKADILIELNVLYDSGHLAFSLNLGVKHED
jgi:hypothetical protein